jgi:hypothetical protein|tara:strand:- start:365 stop:787 length:423 start_codon:yes stop_codon:yes gene_type:complete
MNQKQINLLKEMVDYYNSNIQFDFGKEKYKEYDKVKYARNVLTDLENQIPTKRELELHSNIIDFNYNIKKREHILNHQDFYQTDGCSEVNSICDLEHEIKTAKDEIKEIAMKKLRKSLSKSKETPAQWMLNDNLSESESA